MRQAEIILGNSLVLTLLIGLLYTIVLSTFLEDILRLFGASDITLPYAYDYIIYLMPGFVIMNMMYSFNNMMRGSGYPFKAMITLLIGAVLNVILDPVFIFVFGWGIKGAAIATVISMGISMIFVIWHFSRRSSALHFCRGTYKLSWKVILSIMSIGAAPFLINFAGSAVNAIANNALFKYGGDNAVGAAGIFTTYTQMLVMTVIGVCQGMQPIVGYNYGAGHYDRLRRTYILATLGATIICTLGFVMAQIFPNVIARIFTNDEGLISTTINGLRISLVMFWMVGFQIVSTNFFQSIGKAGKSIFLSMSRQVIFLIPLLFILPGYYELDGVWGAFPTSDTLATIATLFMIVLQFRQLDRKARLS